MKKGIIGAGGFGREVYWSLSEEDKRKTFFFVDDKYWEEGNELILPLSKFDPLEYEIIVAVGDPQDRFNIINRLPIGTKYFTHIHPSCLILDPKVQIGEGSILCPGVILTTNIKIGKHAHLNLHTTVGHDCEIGDYFTSAPGSKISGNCKIQDLVYIGSNASIKEKIEICRLVTIGSNATVVKNIETSGIYVGVPASKINIK